MSQPPQYGPPQTPPPGWGPPPGQPYPGGPGGPYGPPPPKKGLGVGAILGIIFGVIVLGLVLLIVLVALLSGGDSTTTDKPRAGQKTSAPATAAPPSKAPAKEEEQEPAVDGAVKVVASKATFTPSVLHSSGAYTSVKVTITNTGSEKLSVNPLYFSLTDSSGEKHVATLGMDEGQIGTTDLAPGEKITGTITGEGSWTPAYVTFTEGLIGDSHRVAVK
ncbi:DUF4352 domain-containing protein [Streptomyces sp. NBC_01255]|uniref:DUF4352 domain-containing protein n=1 Tax=Streptomyces sp. NBC_01255 TaxID=2903798 RepID=UPI002E364948|nr:DUF4352 domain-containing protein [Streptomyces sp. NBC_01255]